MSKWCCFAVVLAVDKTVTRASTLEALANMVEVVNVTSNQQAVTPGNIMVKYADDTYLVIPACNCSAMSKYRTGKPVLGRLV